MTKTDEKLAKAIQLAWEVLYTDVCAAEVAGLKVHVYVPQDTYNGAEVLRDGDIEVVRQYDIEIAVKAKGEGEAARGGYGSRLDAAGS